MTGTFIFYLLSFTEPNLQFILNLRNQLIKHEGYITSIYNDSLNHKTYGVGHLITSHDTPPETITIRHIEYTLRSDINIAIKDAQSLLYKETWDSMTSTQRSAWVDFTFNLGKTRASKFKKTIYYLNRHEWDKAANQMLKSLWRKQVKGRAITITNMIKSSDF